MIVVPLKTAPALCKRRGCPRTTAEGSVYCTDVHARWDNPVAVTR